MKLQVSIAVFAPLLLAMVLLPQAAISAAEPTWYPYVVARGPDRIAIQNTPMHQRPYRPMHFYGNAVRRSYQRNATPQRNVSSQRSAILPSSRSVAAPLARNSVLPSRGLVRTAGNILLRR